MNRCCPQIFFFLFFALGSLAAEDSCTTLLEKPPQSSSLASARVRSIQSLDRLLTWSLQPKNHPYIFENPPQVKQFAGGGEVLKKFICNHGYFCAERPLVGIVTNSKEDIQITSCLLQSLKSQFKGKELAFATDEILAKVLAYRSLEQGMQIELPNKKIYHVDQITNVWRGMPAFGLVPQSKRDPPILLFRGTDLNLTSEKAWASIMADLDPKGPGLTAYLKAQKHLRQWLKKVQKTHQKARLVGFSLGGIFVLYGQIFDGDLISQRYPSVAFNPPGISKQVLAKYNKNSKSNQLHSTYLNQGDLVSQVGFLLPNTLAIDLKKPMRVLQAHLSLICAKKQFSISKVDVPKENQRRS